MTTVPKFEPNELVDIAIRAARIRSTDDAGWLYIGDNDEFVVDPAAPNVTVTRVAPKEWPPLVGDLWRTASGRKYFGSGVTRLDREAVWLAPVDGGSQVVAGSALAVLGEMGLVYRDGWTPQPVPAAAEPAEVNRTTHAELLDWIGRNIDAGLVCPTAIMFSGDDVELHVSTAGDARLAVGEWATVLTLGEPAFARTYPTYRNYEATGMWSGWQIKVWGSVDLAEPVDQIAADAEQTVAAVVDEPEHGEVEQPNGRAGTAVPA